MNKSRKNIKKVSLLFIMLLLSTINVYAYDYYPDDIYEGNYALEEMLQNYSVITFGKREVSNQANGISKGDAKIFHINSNFLINGKLTNDRDIRVDFRNGKNNLNSYVKSTDRNLYCGNGTSDSCNNDSTLYSDSQFNYNNKTTVVGKYMNFDRLYERIVDCQSKIPKGKQLETFSSISNFDMIDHAFILPSENDDYINDIAAYYIDSDYFTNNNHVYGITWNYYRNVQDKLTIITIDAPGTIELPRFGFQTSDYVFSPMLTNDYYGMGRPNTDYANHYTIETYHGNLIWNIPNATEVILPSYASVGHIIAPNADVISPENQFAGTIIANSISFEGNSEAHFYPLQITDIPYISSTDDYIATAEFDNKKGTFSFSEGLNPELLQEGMVVTFKVNPKVGYEVDTITIKDEDGNTIEYRKISDSEYEFTMPASDVTIIPTFKERSIIDVITNPKTGTPIIIVISILIIMVIGTYLYRKKESKKI